MNSRGKRKLEQAFAAFPVSVEGDTVIDIGSSHGGFASLLLEKGARHVYCIDVAYGILDYSIRRQGKVTALDRHNVREINSLWFAGESFPGRHVFVTCDVSFMSIRTVLSSLCRFLDQEQLSMRGLFLIKPQFEDSKSTQKGILKDETIRRRILDQSSDFARSLGFQVQGLKDIEPEKGKNVESFLFLSRIPDGSTEGSYARVPDPQRPL